MDKYTVDLDQVLNDFEYSELTDQHSLDRSKSNNKQNSTTQYVHNNFKNTNVKHSINNVFHSLNEYLNTDISPKCEIKSVVEEPSFSGENSHIDNNALETVAEETKTVEETTNQNVEEITNQRVEETKVTNDVIEKELIVIEDNPVETVVINEDVTCVNESSGSETDEVALIETIDESIKQKTDIIVTSDDNLEDSVEEIEDNSKTNEEISVEKTEDDGVIKVGFDDDVDLDESELHKYLDELEKEFEETCEEETKINGCEDDEIKEEIKEEPEIGENLTVRPNNLPLPNQEADDTKGIIDLVGEPGSTPYNNVYINKELPQKEKMVETSDTEECSTSASPTFSDISTETNSSCTPSTDTVNDENENGKVEENNVKKDDNVPVEAPPEENAENVDNSSDQVVQSNDTNPTQSETANPPTTNESWLGKQAPLWIPDAEATSCLHCDQKFTVIKRRHHCRACGYVLCSKCCNLKYRLEYLDDVARVCNKCYEILSKETGAGATSSSGSESNSPKITQPNPNNPLEYCSTVPPHQQVNTNNINPPSVMVPVGVLKRKGSNKVRTNKSVMFCDGIRPGSDLTNLDNDFTYIEKKKSEENLKNTDKSFPILDQETKSFIPKGDDLPPTVTINKTDVSYCECSNGPNVVEMLKNEPLIFALQTNLLIHLKIINMDCCINKMAWCFSTEGLINVGQDEIVILLELLDDEKLVPKDIFLHINNIYLDAVKGTSVKEMGLSLHNTSNFLGSKNHAGFVFIRPTFQCLQNIIKPKEPYLIGILIHRWETPWAKLFPLRLILRLGAEYRYYPSPIISNRHRDSVFVEVGHTIINLLADFRNFSYTLPQIRGLTIHMEEKNTTVTIPINRYDQVMKSMNNSSDHILAFAGNFSNQADSHLVCIQDTQSNENAYSTHAINIHNKPRKVTGASFIVFNGALKSSSGLTAKSSIVEDGLMIQIPSEHMVQIRESLRNMKNHTIQCGCINAASDETVNIIWGEPDSNFNINVFSPIDNKPMEGIPSIRVHNGKDYVSGNRLIRWTEVFIVQNEGEASRNQDPIDISKVSETIAKATCTALVKYLDLLVSNNSYKIGIRANLNAFFLRRMLRLHLRKSEIAKFMGVSRPTLYKILKDNNLEYNRFSDISDIQLDRVVMDIKKSHQSAGEIMIQGHLCSRGIFVPRSRLRRCLHRIDAEGMQRRSLRTIRRRIYSVPGPNFIWHIDGTHKLIRWRLVFHMGIDGFSRLIVFGQGSNNNRASTVLNLFNQAVEKYGTPLRVRTDEGGENTGVWTRMQELFPPHSNPVIVGSSVHNQRVERLHRDVNEQVANRYYNLFYEMESMHLLNPENITDLFCLHYVFIPVINKALQEFILAHNNHKISTENNYTPLQLFHMYYHVRRHRSEAEQEFFGGIPQSSLNKNLPHVNVPAISSPLSDEQLNSMKETIDPFSYVDPINAYRDVAVFVAEKMGH